MNWLVQANFRIEADSLEEAEEKLRGVLHHRDLLDVCGIGEFNPNFEKNYGAPPEGLR